MPKPVTDPAVLAQLEAQFAARTPTPERSAALDAQLAQRAFEEEATEGAQWAAEREQLANPTLDAVEGAGRDFKTGLAASGVKTALGVKQLVGQEGDLEVLQEAAGGLITGSLRVIFYNYRVSTKAYFFFLFFFATFFFSEATPAVILTRSR